MAWVESSTGVEEWVPESQVTTPDTPPRTVSPEEPITVADRLRAQRLRDARDSSHSRGVARGGSVSPRLYSKVYGFTKTNQFTRS